MTGERARRAPVDDPAAADADYADAFEIALAQPDTRTAEQWIRAGLEEAPRAVRWTILMAHRYVIGLRLGPLGSRDHVLGWRIAGSGPDEIRLAASSRLLDAVIVGRRADPRHMELTTSLRYRRPALSRVLWTCVGPLHRRIAPLLLERAARRPAAAGTTAARGDAG